MAVVVPLHRKATPEVPPQPAPPLGADALARNLIASKIVPAPAMLEALALHKARRGRLSDILLARGLVTEPTLLSAMGETFGIRVLSGALTPDPRLIDQLCAITCLADHLLPLRVAGSATLVATAHPEDFPRHRPQLEALFGPVLMAVATAHQIEAAILQARGAGLAHLAETRVEVQESCRSYRADRVRKPAVLMMALAILALLYAPGLLLLVATLLALLAGAAFTGLKVAAWLTSLRHLPPEPPPPLIARLPIVSVMVALYRESDIAPRLVQRLGKLDYPRELLDVLLVVEADDSLTREALAGSDLPGWMRVVVVPDGSVKTKPRALNYALDHCRGSIVGVYDAEDAPEPDQIRKIVTRFHARGPDLACLQGQLDFYNPGVNWISRCFTIEYAAWFRLLLPGIERLGLAVPLGGTTLFFRRAALETLGRWDAHNVTEDADLGMRIARHGYRTELIDTTTFEEANCRAGSWVKQRSRWIKGFMMTWLTHMRDPRRLWRDLGPRKFIGFQLLLAGSVLHALLAPVLWALWLVPLGLGHPLAMLMPSGGFGILWMGFLLIEALLIAFGIAGLARTRHGLSWLWVPTMIAYYPLATLAAYKAAWEMLVVPFYWDKTTHGLFDQGS